MVLINYEGHSIAHEIVQSTGMATDPSYYSGMGANLQDLDSNKLEKIYSGIEEKVDILAAKNFVYMVRDIPVMSATDFLITLYHLESNRWSWEGKLISNKKGMYINSRDTAFATAVGAFDSNKKDQTGKIVGQFLANHPDKLKRKKMKKKTLFNFIL
ncbi:hypothetical protein ACFL1H_01620 [Nanoarchaeota archaeon]